MAKSGDIERIFKAAREKKRVTYKRNSMGYQLAFQQKLCRPEKSGMIYSKCSKEKK